MTKAKLTEMLKGITDGQKMIRVFRHNPDGSCSCVLRTFRVDQVMRFLKSKSHTQYHVSQETGKWEHDHSEATRY